jgi:molybdenum cofactor cytidylyltransferase
MQVGIIVLAAGNSSRLGQPKQLIEINGTSLLRKTAIEALQTNYPLVVVLGANAKAHQNVIADLNVNAVINTQWQLGMGNSLKAGFTSLLARYPELQAVMVMVCDQPYLSTDHLQKLINCIQTQNQPIVASEYANTIGVPAIFKKEFFPNLQQVADDGGARKIIEQFSNQVYTVPFENGEIDIDTPQDLLRLPNK